jgi:hypothetical protein
MSGNLKRCVTRSGMTGEDEGGGGTVREGLVYLFFCALSVFM